MSAEYQGCPRCAEYLGSRGPVVAPHMASRLHDTGESASQIMDRFMSGVHARHLAGLPILVPITRLPSRLAGRYAAIMAQIGGAS